MSDFDKYSYHEVVDRSGVITEVFIDTIEVHPVVLKHKKLRKKAHKIVKLMGELYQEASRISDSLK